MMILRNRLSITHRHSKSFNNFYFHYVYRFIIYFSVLYLFTGIHFLDNLLINNPNLSK